MKLKFSFTLTFKFKLNVEMKFTFEIRIVHKNGLALMGHHTAVLNQYSHANRYMSFRQQLFCEVLFCILF